MVTAIPDPTCAYCGHAHCRCPRIETPQALNLLACRKCDTGSYVSRAQPNWMNRWVCDTCGHAISR
jgi:hypothetical protein